MQDKQVLPVKPVHLVNADREVNLESLAHLGQREAREM